MAIILQCEFSIAAALNILSNSSFAANFSAEYFFWEQEENRCSFSRVKNGFLLCKTYAFCRLRPSLANLTIHNNRKEPLKDSHRNTQRGSHWLYCDQWLSKTPGQTQKEMHFKKKDLLKTLTAST